MRSLNSEVTRRRKMSQEMVSVFKAYITGWEELGKLEEERQNVDVGSYPILVEFHPDLERAASFYTREEAEEKCLTLGRFSVKIRSVEGETHICKGFKVEERAPGEFVVFCEAPFVFDVGG
jgi:hypothetical protein